MPEHRIPEVGARIMDLQDPTRKMSTTGGTEEGTVYVLDEPAGDREEVQARGHRLRRPPEIRRGEDKPGVTNLIEILLGGRAGRTPDAGRGASSTARGYGDLKAAVAEAVVAELAPVRERYASCAPTRPRSRRCSRAAPSRRARSPRRRSPTCAR